MRTAPYPPPRGNAWMSESQARRWVRSYWRNYLIQSDAPKVPDLNDPTLRRVWSDETLKIAGKI